eukprot:TRINITY_DN2253_c0_g2_i1.p1 TRINITY_DN2253_c0_g2~~TRINITY_DN2253_c0_g2_i1.p1  ORF type:complete len:139 (+),score=16.35 TRINITY_DN2253_c0_g2_i1:121-537(+)
MTVMAVMTLTRRICKNPTTEIRLYIETPVMLLSCKEICSSLENLAIALLLKFELFLQRNLVKKRIFEGIYPRYRELFPSCNRIRKFEGHTRKLPEASTRANSKSDNCFEDMDLIEIGHFPSCTHIRLPRKTCRHHQKR